MFDYAWFAYAHSSSSWTRSSSLRDFRQDDRHLGSHYYLCYASCLDAIAMSRFLPLVYQACQYAMKQPLTFSTIPANHCLAMLPLCSAPLIALLVAGAVQVVPCWDMDILGYHKNISYLFNANIYLVMGGRLGLLPGVLFHSCHPSFRHTGVMILEYCS